MKAIVHALGYDLQGAGWGNLVIGNMDSDERGRATTALSIALEFGADMSFGTGNSHSTDGRGEATVTRDEIAKRHYRFTFVNDNGFAESLLKNARIDEKSKATGPEIESLLKYAVANGYDMVIVVTDGTHATRARNDLSKAKRKLNIRNTNMITMVADADTEFGGGPENVIVFEPPTNSNDPRNKFPAEDQIHNVLPRIFSLFSRPMNLHGALKEINEVIARWRSMEE